MLNVIEKSQNNYAIPSGTEPSHLFQNLPGSRRSLQTKPTGTVPRRLHSQGINLSSVPVGSSQKLVAPAMIVLNLILAEQLQLFMKDVNALIGKKVQKEEAILKVLKKYIGESKHILFEGNNYSEEWVKEAAKRGLCNDSTTPSALKAMVSKKTLHLFGHHNILNEREMEARHEIHLEDYTKKSRLNQRCLKNLLRTRLYRQH